MTKTSFFRTVFSMVMLGLLVTNVNAQNNVRVLEASTTTCTGSGTCLNWTDSITGSPNPDPSLNVGGGYWSQTYLNTTGFNIGSFKLSHNSGESEYSYWGGFTSGANGDNRNFGYADTTGHAGSVNWVPNQWGVMAGGGLTIPPTVVKGAPYLIAYWDYFSDGIDPDSHSLQISLDSDSLFTPNEIYICNHPWPYYGNIYGDGFARPLNQIGDHFYLWIHAIHNDNSHDSTKVILAENYGDPEPYQESTWQQIDLNALGTNVKYIYFTMESTDELIIGDINYGPNTAVYFNMDKLKVTKTGGVASNVSSVALRNEKMTNTIKAVEVTDYFPVKSHSGGIVTVYDTKGKEVLKTTVKAGEKINLSKLPAGEYRLQHGNKLIPISKKGGNK